MGCSMMTIVDPLITFMLHIILIDIQRLSNNCSAFLLEVMSNASLPNSISQLCRLSTFECRIVDFQ